MKKIFTISILFMLVAYATIGQSLQVLNGDGEDVSNTSVVVQGDFNSSVLASHFDVYNASTTELNVKLKQYYIDLLEGAEGLFCWKECYLVPLSESPDPVVIPPDSAVVLFSGDYHHNDSLGWSRIMYTFFDMSNPSDSVSIIVIYNVNKEVGSTITVDAIDTCFMDLTDTIPIETAFINSYEVLDSVNLSTTWTFIGGTHEFTMDVPYTWTDTAGVEVQLPINCGTKDLITYSFNITIDFEYPEDTSGNSIEELQAINNISTYPNPATDVLSVNFAIRSLDAKLVVYNILGEKMETRLLPVGFGQTRISVSDWKPGMYFWSLYVGNEKVSTQRIIKK